MVKKKIGLIFSMILYIVLAVSFVSGTQDFSVNPVSFSQSVNINSLNSGLITINNTGNETINLTINKVNLVKGTDSITLNLDKTSISNFLISSSDTVNFTYTSSNVAGTYTGKVEVLNTQNLSQNISVPITVIVLPAPSGQNLEIIGENKTLIFSSDLGIRERKNLRFNNYGIVNLTNLQFSVQDLNGITTTDRIDSRDVTFDNEGFNLSVDTYRNVEIQIDIPTNLEIDDYSGILTVTTDEGYSFSWTLEVRVAGAGADVIIQQSSGDVIKGLLTLTGEAGESIRGYDFVVDNIGDIDVNNLIFEIDTDLVEETSGKLMPSSVISFNPNSLSLRKGYDDSVEVRVNIPVDQELGNYYTNIRVKSSTGIEYDKIKLKVQVTGDVYIKNLIVDDRVVPGETLDLEVTLKNKGLQLHRNVKISATLFDIDNSNSDIFKSSSTFILDIDQERTETIKFNIPKNANDGSHTLSIIIQFDNQEFTKITDINIERPRYGLEINSFGVNPAIVSCDKKFFTYMKVENLGKYDENVKVSAEISGTPIKLTSNVFEIGVDSIVQKNTVLDVENLAIGNYILEQRVIYAGSLFKKETTPVQIVECNEFGIGVSINTTDPTMNETLINSNGKVKLFGTELEKSTIYLGSGLSVILVLIVISLFLL